MAGRKSKLTPELQQEIVENLILGCTVRDCCELAGISETIYYRWCGFKGSPYVEFVEAVTQAQAKARRAAVMAVRINLAETRNKVTETVTLEETRLRTVKLPNGTIEQQPYTYRKVTQTNRETQIPPDWRAGIEYLKRRDNRNWSDKITVTFDDLRNQAINDIRAGVLTYEAIAAEDGDLAKQLFELAGVPIEDR